MRELLLRIREEKLSNAAAPSARTTTVCAEYDETEWKRPPEDAYPYDDDGTEDNDDDDDDDDDYDDDKDGDHNDNSDEDAGFRGNDAPEKLDSNEKLRGFEDSASEGVVSVVSDSVSEEEEDEDGEA